MPKGRRSRTSDAPASASNSVRLLVGGEECYPAMLDAIVRARTEVLLEMYWFGSDRTGRRFADALSERARAGVRVLVIYDAVGSLGTDAEMWDAMRAAGCQVHEFHPVSPFARRFRLDLLNSRDHRKILVVDGELAMTGGVNIGDPWAPAADGGEGWRDEMVAIEGPAAATMRELFAHTWRRLGGSALSSLAPSTSPPPRGGGAAVVRVVANRWRSDRRAIRGEYLDRISQARERVWIANSYFIPDVTVRRALTDAAGRGVDVRVLLAAHSDVAAVYWASRRLYGRLLARRVQIFEWHEGILHSKCALVDDRWCTVGTYNLDHRSWRLNLEVNVAIEDLDTTRALADVLRSGFERSTPIDPQRWKYRSLSDRFLELFFYQFRKLL